VIINGLLEVAGKESVVLDNVNCCTVCRQWSLCKSCNDWRCRRS